MATKWLPALVLLAGFQVPVMAEEPRSYARAVEVLRQQVQSANSSRARLEIQMRLLSPDEQRQAGEFGEIEHQLSAALEQLEKGTVAGTMDLSGDFIAAESLDYREWKRELLRIKGVKQPGPAWQLGQVAALINSRQFVRDWQPAGRQVPRANRQMVIEQVNARLLVAIRILCGEWQPDRQPGVLRPTPR